MCQVSVVLRYEGGWRDGKTLLHDCLSLPCHPSVKTFCKYLLQIDFQPDLHLSLCHCLLWELHHFCSLIAFTTPWRDGKALPHCLFIAPPHQCTISGVESWRNVVPPSMMVSHSNRRERAPWNHKKIHKK